MDGPGIGILGNAVAADIGIGFDTDRASTGVRHLLRGGDHVIVIDRQADFKELPRAVVPAERHRAAGRQRAALRGPERVAIRRAQPFTLPAEACEIGVLRARRAVKADGRRILGDRFLIGRQHDVIDARALEVDRAGQLGRADGNARAFPEHKRAVADRGGAVCGGVRIGPGDGHLLAVLDLGCGRIGRGEEIVGDIGPAEKDRRGQQHRQDDILLVVHAFRLRRLVICRVRAPDRSPIRPMGGIALAA